MQLITKTIHYCWFGGKPLPRNAEKCIESWKKYLPDYQIKKWDESNFDVNIIPFTAEAFKARKLAFLTDYARFWILHNYGGIYFDIDVELIRPINDIIEKGAFIGCERNPDPTKSPACLGVNPGLGISGPSGHPFFKKMMDLYSNRHFILADGSYDYTTIVELVTNSLAESGLKNTDSIQTVEDLTIYPRRYFCPMDIDTRKIELSEDTRSIHYYNGSWLSKIERLKSKIKLFVGADFTRFVITIKAKIFRRQTD